MRNHWIVRRVAWVVLFSMTAMEVVPPGIFARPEEPLKPNWNAGLKPGLTQTPGPELQKKIASREAGSHKVPDVRALSAKETRGIRGAGPYRNQYLNGTPPWQKSFHDVNLCDGNLFKSFTDIQIQPGRGAGLALQRTYNSNDDRVGPFGVGWTHAYDIRMEEAGDNEADRTDFFGGKHTYHRDADGLYTPPPYMYDELSSDYESILTNGPPAALDDTDEGEDGTIKHYFANGNERDCDYIQDRYGNRTNLTYGQPVDMGDGSSRGLLATVTDPSGRSLSFTWSNLGTSDQPAWRIVEVDAPNDPDTHQPIYKVTYQYYTDPNDPNAANDLYNLESVTLDPDGLDRTTTYTYTSVTGIMGSEYGLLTSITDPLGEKVSYDYQVDNMSSEVTGSAWVADIYEPGGVDSNNNPRTLTWHVSVFWGTYTSAALAATSNDVGSPYIIVITDSQLRAGGLEPETSLGYQWTYDSSNNVTEQDLWYYSPWFDLPAGVPNSRKDLYTFGPHGNVLTHSIVGRAAVETTTYYDADKYFQKASFTDMNGHTTTYDYFDNQDASPGNRGNVKLVQDARYATTGAEYTYTYNQYGQKASEVNLDGVETDYGYQDAWGNLTEVIQDPGTGHLNRTTNMVYDVAGKVLQSQDPSQQWSSFTYNSLGQPLTASVPAKGNAPAETVTYTYGANGRTQTVTDNRGTTTIAYENGCDRAHSVTDPVTGTLSYTYGLLGERLSMTLPGGGTWQYGYNANTGWGGPFYYLCVNDPDPDKEQLMLTSITDDQGRTETFTLDAAGHLTSERYNITYGSNGNMAAYNEADYSFDNTPNNSLTSDLWLSEVKTTWNWTANEQSYTRVLNQNDYGYDNVGNRLSNTISVQPLNSAGTPEVDQNGNPVVNSRVEQYGYDELNRLTTVNYGDGETQSYSFDNLGNRLQKQDSSGGTTNYTYNNANMLLTAGSNSYTNDADGNTLTGGGRTNTWDSQNRLISCAYSGVTSSYVYGADGLRRQATVNETTTNFVLDSDSVIREMASLNNGTLTRSATYLMGAQGPVCRGMESALVEAG